VTLHSSTRRVPRLARAAAIAIVCMATGAANAAIADDQSVPQVRTVAGTAISRYFDIEANKAASMRALGRRIAEQRENHSSRYQDLEANKTRSQRAH
jgi:predicted outer membrane protein